MGKKFTSKLSYAGMLVIIAASLSSKARASLVTFSFPGASWTSFTGINDAGQIVGYYRDACCVQQGFLDNGGIFSLINVPGGEDTEATGINNAGQIVGYYTDASGVQQGFLDNGGVFSPINVPGAQYTEATGINNAGQIVGYYADASGEQQGFLDNGGVFSPINVPGAASTTVTGINDAGQVVGQYRTTGGTLGFLDTGGIITSIDDSPPGASTYVYGINNAGQILGVTDTPFFTPFLYSGGTFEDLTPPGNVIGYILIPLDMNDEGVIVGHDEMLNGNGEVAFALTTPEPSSMVLLVIGLLGLGGIIRRKLVS